MTQSQERNTGAPETIETVGLNLWAMGDDVTQEDMAEVGDLLTRLMDTTAAYMIEGAESHADPAILTMAAVNYMVATLDRIWRGTAEAMAATGVHRPQYFTVMGLDVAELMLETARGRPMVMTLEEMAALKTKLEQQGHEVSEA